MAITEYQTKVSSHFQTFQNHLRKFGLNNQTADSKIERFMQMIQLYYDKFNMAIQVYMQSVENPKHIPAPVNPEAPAQ